MITGSSVLITSCTPLACFEETNSFVKASLYDNVTKKQKAADSLTVYGLSRDSVKIYDRAKGIQPVLFPLDSSTGSCTFIVSINGITDTITFTYNSYPHLISKECGYTFFHNIDTPYYTRHNIKGIYTGSKNITTENVENLRIFY
jgi:hypothetical protein